MKSNKIILIAGLLCFLIFSFVSAAYAQQAPTYSFIKFDVGYKNIKNQAERNGYKVEEKEINSIYGQSLLLLKKSMNFYSENIYLFFNEKKELIYFNVEFSLNQNQPRRILEELYNSIRDKLAEKYGENDNPNFPFYKVINDQYEILFHPFQVYSNSIDISFKYIDKYNQYQDYYNQQIKKLEAEDINNTVNNF